jgi:hypothetical protein
MHYQALTIVVFILTQSISLAQGLEGLVQFLNQEPTKQSAYPHKIEIDLAKLNTEEWKQIERSWNGAQEPVLSESKSHRRERKNVFFQNEVRALNGALEQWIQDTKAGATSQLPLAKRILRGVAAHPITGMESVFTREHSGEIGFCFGRALFVHRELLKAGMAQQDLVKIFALGELSVDKQLWRFHVAVGIRDPKQGILMIDPLFPEVQSIAQWMREIEKFDIKFPYSRTRFYPTDPRKFLPSGGRYDKAQLNDPVFKKYFTALASSL